jgi:hypothetical protein
MKESRKNSRGQTHTTKEKIMTLAWDLSPWEHVGNIVPFPLTLFVSSMQIICTSTRSGSMQPLLTYDHNQSHANTLIHTTRPPSIDAQRFILLLLIMQQLNDWNKLANHSNNYLIMQDVFAASQDCNVSISPCTLHRTTASRPRHTQLKLLPPTLPITWSTCGWTRECSYKSRLNANINYSSPLKNWTFLYNCLQIGSEKRTFPSPWTTRTVAPPQSILVAAGLTTKTLTAMKWPDLRYSWKLFRFSPAGRSAGESPGKKSITNSTGKIPPPPLAKQPSTFYQWTTEQNNYYLTLGRRKIALIAGYISSASSDLEPPGKGWTYLEKLD